MQTAVTEAGLLYALSRRVPCDCLPTPPAAEQAWYRTKLQANHAVQQGNWVHGIKLYDEAIRLLSPLRHQMPPQEELQRKEARAVLLAHVSPQQLEKQVAAKGVVTQFTVRCGAGGSRSSAYILQYISMQS